MSTIENGKRVRIKDLVFSDDVQDPGIYEMAWNWVVGKKGYVVHTIELPNEFRPYEVELDNGETYMFHPDELEVLS